MTQSAIKDYQSKRSLAATASASASVSPETSDLLWCLADRRSLSKGVALARGLRSRLRFLFPSVGFVHSSERDEYSLLADDGLWVNPIQVLVPVFLPFRRSSLPHLFFLFSSDPSQPIDVSLPFAPRWF